MHPTRFTTVIKNRNAPVELWVEPFDLILDILNYFVLNSEKEISVSFQTVYQ